MTMAKKGRIGNDIGGRDDNEESKERRKRLRCVFDYNEDADDSGAGGVGTDWGGGCR